MNNYDININTVISKIYSKQTCEAEEYLKTWALDIKLSYRQKREATS